MTPTEGLKDEELHEGARGGAGRDCSREKLFRGEELKQDWKTGQSWSLASLHHSPMDAAQERSTHC